MPTVDDTTGKTTKPSLVSEKVVDAGESSKPRRKLSKEERTVKRARKAKRRARKAAEKAADADVHDEAKDHVPKEEVPPIVQPTVSDKWLSEYEQQYGNAEEEAQESNEEDVVVVISRRRKATGKLKLNENQTRVGNKRLPKNIVAVSTANVAQNSEEEEAKWRFVANRSVVAEKMLSEVTKKNANIIGIVEGAGVIPTVETVGPYYPKLVKEFIYNIAEDVDDLASRNFQKVDETTGASGNGNEETARILRDGIRYLDGVIQTRIARMSVLEVRLRSLTGAVDLSVDGSGAEAPHT
ncbi:hypothetical protein LIER_37603 [Lithospermum erythrorhizon]|uniref:Uncharacterized protein n=1 Tax=Lithospermum erythrorhizon TaxID=34254 RepID=A0AAV3PMQ1_LITER